MRIGADLTGKRFGKLVVRELYETAKGQRKWLCDCDCGNTHVATTGNLNSGHTTNCGCLKSPDLTGKVFGRLTVLCRSEERIVRGSKTRVAWECVCTCGNHVLRTSETLRDGKDRMCAECARRNGAEKAFLSAGFEGGTQITKIQNMTLTAANTSGCRGVYWHKRTHRWQVRIKFKGKLLWVGSYTDFDEAVKARQRAEEEVYGTFLASINQ